MSSKQVYTCDGCGKQIDFPAYARIDRRKLMHDPYLSIGAGESKDYCVECFKLRFSIAGGELIDDRK